MVDRDRHLRRGVLVDPAPGEAMTKRIEEHSAGHSIERRATKSTCRKCNRTVHIDIVDGLQVETDPELISVIVFEKRNACVEHARRLHAERCEDYQQEAKKTKLQAERHLWNSRQPPRIAKKAPTGRREPGQ